VVGWGGHLAVDLSFPGRGLSTEPQLESARWVEHINRAYASLFTNFVLHANRVGYEDGLNFWGGSTVFDPDGKLLAKDLTMRRHSLWQNSTLINFIARVHACRCYGMSARHW